MSELKDNDLKERLKEILSNTISESPVLESTDLAILRAMTSAYNLDRDNEGLKSRVKQLEEAINYALTLLTNTPPQHRREFHSTACAALRKVVKPLPNPPQS